MQTQQVWIAPGKKQKEKAKAIKEALSQLPDNNLIEFISVSDNSIVFQFLGTMMDNARMMTLGASSAGSV